MSSINVPSVFSIRQCKEGTSPSILYIQSVNTPAPIECTYMGVINGKTGKTAGLSNFSDIFTLSQSRGADYAHPNIQVLSFLKNPLITTLTYVVQAILIEFLRLDVPTVLITCRDTKVGGKTEKLNLKKCNVQPS